jgi:hypothetical protein
MATAERNFMAILPAGIRVRINPQTKLAEGLERLGSLSEPAGEILSEAKDLTPK